MQPGIVVAERWLPPFRCQQPPPQAAAGASRWRFHVQITNGSPPLSDPSGADNALVGFLPYERTSSASHPPAIHKCKHTTRTEMGATRPGNLGGIMQASEVTSPWAHREVVKSFDKITFDPKPLKLEGWYVVVTYPGGVQEHIPSFHSEAEAEEWLAGKCQTWLRARGYAK